MATQNTFPQYAELPKKAAGFHCSWDYFNSLQSNTDRKDQIGTLNFLTADRRAEAAKNEIISGRSISLELPIDFFAADSTAFGGRPPPVHKLREAAPFAYEDSIDFNTQSSSQWDGFRHFAIRESLEYYNGYKAADFSSGDVLSTHSWLEAGGICGRGVLIDFYCWATQQGETIDVNGGRPITLSDIRAVLEFQGTVVRPGDILVFRTGWLDWYKKTDPEERHKELCLRHEPGKHSFIGLAQEQEFVEWLWNNQIAAVAGDQVAFECTPPPADGFGWLHEHLLAALGCPIGELWDTEALAAHCNKTNRHSFFLTSAPLAVRGGVGSTANALAIF
ncbi:hypothetical protein GQ53DRAFT_791858 [Thozetella sp. PMI_491]|nr:hypothetical protein GQ53DRAFT_791858 [Thozetella sp. PMI_491]